MPCLGDAACVYALCEQKRAHIKCSVASPEPSSLFGGDGPSALTIVLIIAVVHLAWGMMHAGCLHGWMDGPISRQMCS
jgi:hypothetical protein